jgi:hypothetical protein
MSDDREFVNKILDRALETNNLELAGLAVRAASALAPTREIGAQRNYQGPRTAGGLDLGWASFIDTTEHVPDLAWPMSIRAYKYMRTDSQLSGLYRAMTYPIRRFKFLIEPNGARPQIVQGLADDLNLDIVGHEPRPRGRRKRRFSFPDFLYHALLGLIYGHMPFEIVGEIIPAPDFPGGQRWALRKLDPRMPDTISMINVAEDGGLISIKQNLMTANTMQIGGPEIPVDQLVWFAWEKEGPNWPGRSIFRDCYRNWLVKDRLIRIDAINHERAGGIHIAKAPQGASPAEIGRLSEMAQRAVVSEGGGGAIPFGSEYDIKKAGSGTDVIGSIKYHDESMARLMLHMFIQLGMTESGSRALGESFIEYAYIAQSAVAQWFIDVFNEHVIEDWVDWNWGEDEQAPLLTFNVEEENEKVAVADLVALIGAGVIVPDDELEDTLRERYMLPARGANPRETVNVPGAAATVEQTRLRMLDDYEASFLHQKPPVMERKVTRRRLLGARS